MRRVLLVMLVSLPMGCGTTAPIVPLAESCITIDNVVNIPPGDATGSVSLGTYHPVTNLRLSCGRCDLNAVADAVCTGPTVDPTVHTTFTQVDGVLTAESTDGTKMQGSINTDRSSVLGAVITPSSTGGT